MAATLTTIAKEAGVSVSLVSRLLSGDRTLSIRDATRQRVLDARERCGGVRLSRRARSQSRNVVVPVNAIFKPGRVSELVGRELLSGAEAWLAAREGRLSLTGFDAARRLETFRGWCDAPGFCDGLLLLTGLLDQPLAELLQASRMPRVSVEHSAERLGIHSVTENVFGGYLDVLDHLVALGHRRIGHIGPQQHRYSFFMAAKIDMGLSVDPAYNGIVALPAAPEEPDWRALGQGTAAAVLARGCTATAWVCHNDATALGVMDALRAAGLRPGRDRSVVGFDNVEDRADAPTPAPRLTTIDHPLDRTGQRCAAMLLEQMAHGVGQVVHERVPVRLVIRESTGPAPTEQADAARIRREGSRKQT